MASVSEVREEHQRILEKLNHAREELGNAESGIAELDRKEAAAHKILELAGDEYREHRDAKEQAQAVLTSCAQLRLPLLEKKQRWEQATKSLKQQLKEVPYDAEKERELQNLVGSLR